MPSSIANPAVTMMSYLERQRTAEAVAREAGALAREHAARLSGLKVERKGVQDLVSTADREVEALVKQRLAAAFPDDGFIGEETGGAARDNVWVLDPIDGTTNFVYGLPIYTVAIAFVSGGKTRVGVIHDPTHDELFSAVDGAGATCNGKPLRVRDTARLDQAVLTVGFAICQPAPALLAALGRLLEAKCEFRRFGSAAFSLAQVAAGRLDGFWQSHLWAWDALAGMLLVREAGGATNDFLRDPNSLISGSHVLATTLALHEPLSRLLNA